MRGSLKKLAGAVSGDSSSSSAGGGGGDAGAEWLRALAGSAWLSHCAELLAASCLVADRLHCGAPVLVHCSDGWDRTSQIVATVQLLCDPHFRTLRGFGDLVEKDWCAFGHMFEVRGGGLHVATSGGSGGGTKASSLSHDDPKAEHETSPIFLQWLEVVWQLTAQFPAAFEFGEALLLFLADHVHALAVSVNVRFHSVSQLAPLVGQSLVVNQGRRRIGFRIGCRVGCLIILKSQYGL